MKEIYTSFPANDILIEGIWHLPESVVAIPAVIVCHPHPLYGGNMSNNVVLAICQALALRSVAAFRFNFRGVGKSGGTYGGGIAEREDVRAALGHVLSTPDIDPARVGIAAYSFGASVSLPVALHDERVSLIAMVSPALSDEGWEQLKAYTRPKFIIIGDDDFVIPVSQLRQHIEDVPEPKQWQVAPGVDHFWSGYEEVVAEQVTRFFTTGFGRTS